MTGSTRDYPLYVRYDEGSGPVIVLLHGINADAADWRKVIDTIGTGYRCIALDLLGFGESPKPLDLDYTADDHTEAIDATLQSLGIHERFLLVGYSLGGDIAIRYAATYPRKIRRLFLLSTPFYLPSEEYSARGFSGDYATATLLKAVWGWVARGKESKTLAYQIANGQGEEFAKGFLRTDDVSEHWEIMGRNLKNCIAAATFVDDLPKLDMPVTFALGVKDPIVRPDQTPALKRLKPEIEIRRIVGLSADHFMLLNLPEQVAHEIMRDEIRGLHVAYRSGAGDPVVFLHGLQTTSDQWRPTAEAFSHGQRALVFDLLGFGDSPVSLTLLYTLEDHVAAVARTIRREVGDRPVRLVGQGLGGLVALGCAAWAPELVADVTAFSPTMVEPGGDIDARAANPAIADILAARESYASALRDDRARVAADRLEERSVPLVRSLDNAILDTDSDALLSRIHVPVRIVIGTDEVNAPTEYLQRKAAEKDDFEVVVAEGSVTLAMSDAVAAVDLVDPYASDAVRNAARRAKPHRHHRSVRLSDMVISADNAQLGRASLAMLAGLVLLLLPLLVPDLVDRQALIRLAFGGWVLAEGGSTLVGAIGLARAQKAWLVFFLMGALTLAVGWLVFSSPELGNLVIGLYVAARAIAVGAAGLWSVRAVPDPAVPRWLLWFQGVLGITIALLVIFEPALGGRLLRLTLSGYLISVGFTGAAYAWGSRRRTRARIRRLVGE